LTSAAYDYHPAGDHFPIARVLPAPQEEIQRVVSLRRFIVKLLKINIIIFDQGFAFKVCFESAVASKCAFAAKHS
jgi:hypothetical protein